MDLFSGASVINYHGGYIGYDSTSTGVVTVDGPDSRWTSFGIWVGCYGSGALNISNGGSVTALDDTRVAYAAGSTGTINFGDGGGTLTTRRLFASPTQITGSGVISTRGLVSDVNLIFDSTDDLIQTVPGFGNVAVKLDMSGVGMGDLGAGYYGNGSLTIRNGVAIYSSSCYLGYSSASVGVATVEGSGSSWHVASTYVGYSGQGTLNILGGTSVAAGGAFIGYNAGARGEVTVDGVGSTWATGGLTVGRDGTGALNISNGATVNVTGATSVGAGGTNSSGTISFGAGGGTLTTQDLGVSANQLTGTGTINTCGLTSDVDLVFDSPSSLRQTLELNARAGQHITVNLDLTGAQTGVGSLGAGWNGNGSFLIKNGVVVESTGGVLGANSGSSGIATIEGAGTTWSVEGLNIGDEGLGILNIIGGASVVTASSVRINTQSRLLIDVGSGSSLILSGTGCTGGIVNGGVVCLVAGAIAEAGVDYSPISAEWLGGDYQAVGGKWDEASHTFTASAVQSGGCNEAISIDLANIQRLLVHDDATGWSVGASFLHKDGSTPLEFMATAMADTIVASLRGQIPTADECWRDGSLPPIAGICRASRRIYRSTSAPIFQGRLKVWHYDGSSWTPYDAADLTCNGGWRVSR